MSGAGRKLTGAAGQGSARECVPAGESAPESIPSFAAGLNTLKGLSQTRWGIGES